MKTYLPGDDVYILETFLEDFLQIQKISIYNLEKRYLNPTQFYTKVTSRNVTGCDSVTVFTNWKHLFKVPLKI